MKNSVHEYISDCKCTYRVSGAYLPYEDGLCGGVCEVALGRPVAALLAGPWATWTGSLCLGARRGAGIVPEARRGAGIVPGACRGAEIVTRAAGMGRLGSGDSSQST